jgi:hypothetical protein
MHLGTTRQENSVDAPGSPLETRCSTICACVVTHTHTHIYTVCVGREALSVGRLHAPHLMLRALSLIIIASYHDLPTENKYW